MRVLNTAAVKRPPAIRALTPASTLVLTEGIKPKFKPGSPPGRYEISFRVGVSNPRPYEV
ncbi:hypothetical protein D3C72_2298620 [compost metagenome]